MYQQASNSQRPLQRGRFCLIRFFRHALILPLIIAFFALKGMADPPPHIVRKEAVLEKITPREIGLPGSNALAIEENPVSIDIDAYGNPLDGPDMELRELLPPGTVRRRIDDLWQWKILKNKNDASPIITATYTITGLNGQQGVLSHPADPSSTIRVTIEPLTQSWEEKNNQWICTGGVELLMELSDIEKSGNYRGSIHTLISIDSI